MSMATPRRAARIALTVGLMVGAACVGASATSTPALAAPAPYPPAVTGHSDPCAVAPVLDGFAICVLPRGLGSLVTDFEYEWEGVTHRSRVWETGPDKDGAYRVDLTVKVMRGASLTSLEALRDYLADYHERDPAEWKLKAFDNNGRPGYRTADEAFWWEAPGVAVSVTINGERYAERDLVRTAKGLRAVRS